MAYRYLIVLALLLAALWVPRNTRADGETPINSYTVTEVDALVTAFGINNAGQLAGASAGRAFLWHNGVTTDLGTLGGVESIALGVNNSGQVAGRSTTATGNTHAFLWDAAAGIRDLGTLGGAHSGATGINDAGQVVGWSHLANGQARPFLWQNGRMYNLGTLPGGISATASGISAAGQVVGSASDGIRTRAFLWTPTVRNGTTGTMVTLPASTNSWALGINASGGAVGQVGDQPYLWDRAGANALPLLLDPGNVWAATGVYGGGGVAINDAGHVVGYALHWWWSGEEYGGAFTSAITWSSVTGTRQLGALTDQLLWLDEASALNNQGTILAHGSGKAYLLTPSPLPVRPQGLWGKAGDARAELRWSLSYGAASPTTYTVKRAAQSGGPYVIVASGITGATFADTAVVNGAAYHYVVSAVNAYGESAPSNEVRVIPEPVPAPPTGLAGAGGDERVTLTWNASPGASYYKLHRSTSPGGPYDWFDYTSDTVLVDTGFWDESGGYPLQNGTTYYYVVTAVGGTGESGYSQEASATPTGPPPPAAPTGLTAAWGKKKGTITLKWTQSPGSGVTQNRIYRSSTSGGDYALRATISAGMAYTDTGLTSGATYHYVVTAVSGGTGKESVFSNQAPAKAR